MTLMEAHILALKVLKQVMEEKLDENNVQLAQVCTTFLLIQYSSTSTSFPCSLLEQVTKEKGFHILGESELKEVIESIAA